MMKIYCGDYQNHGFKKPFPWKKTLCIIAALAYVIAAVPAVHATYFQDPKSKTLSFNQAITLLFDDSAPVKRRSSAAIKSVFFAELAIESLKQASNEEGEIAELARAQLQALREALKD